MSTSELSANSTTRPTWEVAHLFPPQGCWSESDFFRLHSNQLVELVDGHLEILPMPTWMHQMMVKFLLRAIEDHIGDEGEVLDAPLPIRLFPKTIREPDVMYFAPGSEPENPRGYPSKVDLAIEVVSDGDTARWRDYEDKRADYARANVPEYWIVDPEGKCVLVLVLREGQYDLDGKYQVGEAAASRLLEGLTVDVAKLMSLCEPKKHK